MPRPKLPRDPSGAFFPIEFHLISKIAVLHSLIFLAALNLDKKKVESRSNNLVVLIYCDLP
jgi:hypothetical protein